MDEASGTILLLSTSDDISHIQHLFFFYDICFACVFQIFFFVIKKTSRNFIFFLLIVEKKKRTNQPNIIYDG